MYEVEIKIEITQEEKAALIEQFKIKNFPFKGMTPQADFYIHAVPSPYGGYDIERYRHEADEYIFTKKTWEIAEGEPVRKEEENSVSAEVFAEKIQQHPPVVSIKKEREWFDASYGGHDITITIDSVKFDHSPAMRYFIEAEMVVENSGDVKEAKDVVRRFLKKILGKEEIVNALGMFTMAFTKQ